MFTNALFLHRQRVVGAPESAAQGPQAIGRGSQVAQAHATVADRLNRRGPYPRSVLDGRRQDVGSHPVAARLRTHVRHRQGLDTLHGMGNTHRYEVMW